MNGSLNDNSVRVRKLFEPLRDYDASSRNCLVVDHNLSECNPDAKMGTDLACKLLIMSMVGSLERQCRSYCIRRSLKPSYQCVTTDLMRRSAMARYRLGEPPEGVLNSFVSELFVLLNESGRADHIGVQDDSKLRSLRHGFVPAILFEGG